MDKYADQREIYDVMSARMAIVDPVGVDLARRIYDYGLTPDDFGPRQYGRAAATKARAALALPWPAGLAPKPQELADEPDVADPLPRADVLVVTWTAAEMLALADTLTPGVNPRTRWYRYAAQLRGVPARHPRRRAGARRRPARLVLPDAHRLEVGAVRQVGAPPQPGRRGDRRRHGHDARRAVHQAALPGGEAAARHHRRHRRWHAARRRAGRRDDHPHGEVQVHQGVPQRAVRHQDVHVGGDDPAQAPGGGSAR